MELEDLLNKPVSELSIEDLEENIRLLRKLKVSAAPKKSSKPKASKSNKDKRLEDLLKKLSPNQIKALLKETP